MASPRRFPSFILPPLRDYGFRGEETRSKFEPEVGVPRRRNLTRVVPEVTEAKWMMRPDEYQAFEKWWQYVIKGGALDFDIQLSDPFGNIAWYTVEWVGEFRASVVKDYYWQVEGTLRTLQESFPDNPAGTDELAAHGIMEMYASGALVVIPAFHGQATMEMFGSGMLLGAPFYASTTMLMFATGSMSPRPFWGTAVMEMSATAAMQQFGDPSLILQFDDVEYTIPDGGNVILQFDDVEYYPPKVEIPG